jgi:hypothetical protein
MHIPAFTLSLGTVHARPLFRATSSVQVASDLPYRKPLSNGNREKDEDLHVTM